MFIVEDDEGIAFSAYHGSRQYYYAGERIQFDNIITNYGGYFDEANSTFTCPVQGLYMFTVNIMAYSSDQFGARIVINGVTLVTAWADNASSVYNQASNTVIVECGPGDDVWSEAVIADYIYCNSVDRYSTFSGVLIKQTPNTSVGIN